MYENGYNSLTLAIYDIDSALKAELYYLALVGALHIPHICGALEDPSNRSRGQEYTDWFNHNAASLFQGFLTAEVCYSLRCGIIHQGQVLIPGRPDIKRILFLLPKEKFHVDLNIQDDMLQLDLVSFCRRMLHAAITWAQAKQGDTTVLGNETKLLHYFDGVNPIPGLIDGNFSFRMIG